MFIPLLFTIPITVLCYYNYYLLCYYELNDSIILWYNNRLLCNGSYCQRIRASRGTQYKIQNAITNNYFIFWLLVTISISIYNYVIIYITIAQGRAGKGSDNKTKYKYHWIILAWACIVTISAIDHTTISYVLYKYICIYIIYIVYISQFLTN